MNISKWNLLLFHVLLFSKLLPFFIFYYLLYFKAMSQPIMKINTPNWSLGLVEYIIYNHIYFADVINFRIIANASVKTFCLLDQQYHIYNLSCCHYLNVIFECQNMCCRVIALFLFSHFPCLLFLGHSVFLWNILFLKCNCIYSVYGKLQIAKNIAASFRYYMLTKFSLK